MDPNPYLRQCIIHIRYPDTTRDQVGHALSGRLGFPFRCGTIWTDWASIEVSQRDEWDRINIPDDPVDFSLELIANDDIPLDVFQSRIKSLLRELAAHGHAPIPAYDTEDALEGWDKPE